VLEYIYLTSIIRPRAELHETFLLVKREVLDVYGAVTLVDGRWLPDHFPRVHHLRLNEESHLEVAVGTARTFE